MGGRIQCAAHRPPRAGVVMQRVVMHDSSFGRLIRIRFCRNHVKSSGSRRKTSRKCFADPARTENFRNLSKFGRKLTEESVKSATWTTGERKSMPKACPKTAPCTTQDPPGIPRRVTRLVLNVGFWHSGAAGTSAPPRKNKDFGCFGDVRNGLAQ